MIKQAIETQDLTKYFRPATGFADLVRGRIKGKPFCALHEVTLSVNEGEILGVVGPNGAGKTTLLRLLAGLLLPSSGRACVLGVDVAHAQPSFREQVTYVVADERAFSLRLTGAQNLRFFATLYGWQGQALADRVERNLEIVGLTTHAAVPVSAYSTGMRARLALARGLLGEAKVLLLDEPTRGIDPWASVTFRRLLTALAGEGRTLVISSHLFDEVRELCQRTAVLDQGRLLGVVPVAEAQGLIHA